MSAGARRGALALGAAGLLALAGCGSAGPHTPLALPRPSALPRSASSHVVVIVMENKERGEVVGSPAAPYVSALARRYAVATHSYAIRHPSLPNYLALTSGSTHGIDSDCTDCHVAGANIVDQLEGAHLTWKAYMEDLPKPCSPVGGAGGYAKKHDPFMYYDDVVHDARRCGNVVGFGRLVADLSAGTLPAFAFISPNLCHDTHDCGVAAGDSFLSSLVPRLLRELGPHGFLVLTWDEGSSDAGCCTDARGGRIATVVAGPGARRGARSDGGVDHYGVLGTIEDALGLPRLAGAASPRAGTLDTLLTHGALSP